MITCKDFLLTKSVEAIKKDEDYKKIDSDLRREVMFLSLDELPFNPFAFTEISYVIDILLAEKSLKRFTINSSDHKYTMNCKKDLNANVDLLISFEMRLNKLYVSKVSESAGFAFSLNNIKSSECFENGDMIKLGKYILLFNFDAENLPSFEYYYWIYEGSSKKPKELTPIPASFDINNEFRIGEHLFPKNSEGIKNNHVIIYIQKGKIYIKCNSSVYIFLQPKGPRSSRKLILPEGQELLIGLTEYTINIKKYKN